MGGGLAAQRPAHARNVARICVTMETVAAAMVTVKSRAGAAVPRITERPITPVQMRRATEEIPNPITIDRMPSVAPGGRTAHGSSPARGTSAGATWRIGQDCSPGESAVCTSGPSYTGQSSWCLQKLHAMVRESDARSPSRRSKRHAANIGGVSVTETTYCCQSGTVWRQRIPATPSDQTAPSYAQDPFQAGEGWSTSIT